jgi:hypothetical protein
MNSGHTDHLLRGAIVIGGLLSFVVVLPVLGQSPASQPSESALISRELDQRISIKLDGDLPTAIKGLSDKTGLIIEPDPQVWTLLPWGEQTTVTADIQNATVRQALDAIGRKLGLEFVAGDHSVLLEPIGPLRRLARRATIDELAALNLLASTPVEIAQAHPTLTDVLGDIDHQLQRNSPAYSVEDQAINARGTVDPRVSVPRGATMMAALDAIDNQTGETWYPWGKTIVVLTRRDMVQYLLGRTVWERFDGVDVGQAMTDLADRGGIAFKFEPGCLAAIPPQLRTINLSVEDATIRQCLESICGLTGLAYEIRDDGVHVTYHGPTTRPG